MSIGLQASIVGYMVSSFFASVAYNWFIYYLIAYAVAFRRIYSLEERANEAGTSQFEPKQTSRSHMTFNAEQIFFGPVWGCWRTCTSATPYWFIR